MLGPRSRQPQRDLRTRSGDNATGQERRAKDSFPNASFREEKSHWVWSGGGGHKGSLTQGCRGSFNCR